VCPAFDVPLGPKLRYSTVDVLRVLFGDRVALGSRSRRAYWSY
jgi:hypothetical protein